MREQKKKEREEEQRKRKATAAKKRAAVYAEKATIEAEKKAAAEAKKAAAEARKAAAAVGDELNRKQQVASYTTQAKQPRLGTDADIPFSSHSVTTSQNVDENECCVCFLMYSEDEDWVQCGCSRWLHERCITEVIIDISGKELFCPFCAFDMRVRSLISCI